MIGSLLAWIDLVEDLRGALHDAAAERNARRGYVPTDEGPQPGWVLHERQVMLERTNDHLADSGRGPATEGALRAVEGSASGHADYVAKYAVGCAEIVAGRRSAETGLPLDTRETR